MTKEAMQQALEALEVEQIEVQLFRLVPKPHLTKAITALREALAKQPAQQEPVTWCSQCGHKCPQPAPIQQEPVGWWDDKLGFFAEKHFDQLQPIYKSPPAQQKYDDCFHPSSITVVDELAQRQARSADTWVGLTDEERIQFVYHICNLEPYFADPLDAAVCAIEAKLKEKNT